VHCIRRLSRHLQILGRPECDFLACFDFDRFTGCGIAPHAGCAIFDQWDTEGRNTDSFALLKMRRDYVDERASNHVQDILVSHVVGEPTGRFGRDWRAAWRLWPPFVRLATRVHVLRGWAEQRDPKDEPEAKNINMNLGRWIEFFGLLSVASLDPAVADPWPWFEP
jgi:hypothetical protein